MKVHFDECQFEQHRQDGIRKLKPNAVPTLFGETLKKYLENKSPKQNGKIKKSFYIE